MIEMVGNKENGIILLEPLLSIALDFLPADSLLLSRVLNCSGGYDIYVLAKVVDN